MNPGLPALRHPRRRVVPCSCGFAKLLDIAQERLACGGVLDPPQRRDELRLVGTGPEPFVRNLVLGRAPFEKVFHPAAQDVREVVQPRRAHPVAGLLILLDLLRSDTDSRAKIGLRQARPDPQAPQVLRHYPVDGVRTGFPFRTPILHSSIHA